MIRFIRQLLKPFSRSKKPTPTQPKSPPAQHKQPAKRTQPTQKPKPKPKWQLSQFQVEVAEGKTRFHDLLPASENNSTGLSFSLMHAIADLEFQYCSPIQAETLPYSLMGKDVTGQAQTGTGKTAAFLITMINRYLRNPISGRRKTGAPRGLILAPTRELVMQIAQDARDLSKHSNLRIAEAFGGMDYQKQQNYLQSRPVDILVATPGRLMDFQRKRVVDLRQVEILVLDEADRMLDMGFIPDVKQIVRSTPQTDKRQTLFFSATFTTEVRWLADEWTNSPEHIVIKADTVAADSVEQIMYLTTTDEKFVLLYNLISQQNLQKVMVFTNQRHETRMLTDRLYQHGISCEMLSGEVAQNKRVRTLDDFRSGKIRVLVATDVAGRGIHIEGVSHVVNYTLPEDPEDYVHRIGRTGRAGEKGIAISFASEEDAFYIPAIREYLGLELACVQPETQLLDTLPKPVNKPRPRSKPQDRVQSGRGGQRQNNGNRPNPRRHSK